MQRSAKKEKEKEGSGVAVERGKKRTKQKGLFEERESCNRIGERRRIEFCLGKEKRIG